MGVGVGVDVGVGVGVGDVLASNLQHFSHDVLH